jgi:Trk-type K+ transport system membrane component
MTAWETIKTKMTVGTMPGSFGEGMKINEAVSLFVAIKHYLKDEEGEIAVFNADEEVSKAIMQRRLEQELKDAGVL